MVMVHDSRDYSSATSSSSIEEQATSRRTDSGAVVYEHAIDVQTITTDMADIQDTLMLAGDTRIRVKNNSVEMFHFWFHTNFIDPEKNSLLLTKKELDCKSIKKDKKYTDDFGIELQFQKITPAEMKHLQEVANIRRQSELEKGVASGGDANKKAHPQVGTDVTALADTEGSPRRTFEGIRGRKGSTGINSFAFRRAPSNAKIDLSEMAVFFEKVKVEQLKEE
jgi:hypothetical protein